MQGPAIVWPLDIAVEVIEALVRDGSGIHTAWLASFDDGDVRLVSTADGWGETLPRDVDRYYGIESRLDGEAWDAFVARSAAAARSRVARWQKQVRGHAPPVGTAVVWLTWTNEAELSLFDVPAGGREHARAVETEPRDDEQRGLQASDWNFGVTALAPPRAGAREIGRARPVPGSFYGRSTSTLAGVPTDAKWLRVDSDFDLSALRALRGLEGLSVGLVDARDLAAIAKIDTLRYLVVHGVKAGNLDALGALDRLEHLAIIDALQVTSLRGFRRLDRLRSLKLEHFRDLRDLSDVGEITSLRAFGFAGAIWTDMKVKSLAPLSTLRQLRRLHTVSTSVLDRSLEPLANLPHLQRFTFGGGYPLEEVARLARAKPRLQGFVRSLWLLRPVPMSDAVGCCKRCNAWLMGQPHGGGRWLCPDCDAARIAKLQAKWDAVVFGKTPARGSRKGANRGAKPPSSSRTRRSR